MNYKSHIYGGVAVWLHAGAALSIGVNDMLVTAPVAIVGALTPDLDHPKSRIGSLVPFLSRPISALIGHRGFSHSGLCVLAMALAFSHLVLMDYPDWTLFVQAWLIGYLSHMLCDAFTARGVPLLWPNRARWRVPLIWIRTGREPEMWYVLIMLMLGLQAFVATVGGAQPYYVLLWQMAQDSPGWPWVESYLLNPLRALTVIGG
ncbi:metal-dependent hydrolase [Ferrimonas marina]|uniref:LexA-binding, inner membrane-associated putative hydrolase n=1 Tax=Ferrimonas marina TaxID=299255 RepID=A0A1M5TA92_9GAMM|nr:metal-dependent hydrolase [Ferrimonas marina]SHH47586.1 LexA-binding, inner membrane-associated putative hydrolase [Ferrimonas marina]